MVNDVGANSLEKLLNDGWGYHDTESDRLARELEAAVGQGGVAPEFLIGFLHLSIHTLGDHLADWPRALALGQRALDGRTPAAETGRAWRWLYVAGVLAGDSLEAVNSELSYLNAAGDEFGAALLDMRFLLAEALIGAKRASESAKVYRDALDLAGRVPQSAFLDRTIAISSNNLGWELYERPQRTAEEDALMTLTADESEVLAQMRQLDQRRARALSQSRRCQRYRRSESGPGGDRGGPRGHRRKWRTPARCGAPSPCARRLACGAGGR